MTTKSAKDFRQRAKEYKADEDGRNFKAWYHVDDVKRILWTKFKAIDNSVTQDTLHPYVFFDGLDQFPLDKLLNPLIKTLKSSDKKFYPFIFKPELASAHYMAGFLRKNEDKTISIIIFNPTGTLPRVDYGEFGFTIQLLNDPDDSDHENYDDLYGFDNGFAIEEQNKAEIGENKIYVRTYRGALEYTLIDTEGFELANTFSADDLTKLGIKIDLTAPLSAQILNDEIKPKLTQILNETIARGETTKRIEIISSPHKVQTSDKDGGPLVSCGPLCVEFIDYAMSHPEYMTKLDEKFDLPPSLTRLLNPDQDEYYEHIMSLRHQHDKLLDTIDDSYLEEIDTIYDKVTGAFPFFNDDTADENEDAVEETETTNRTYSSVDIENIKDDLYKSDSAEDTKPQSQHAQTQHAQTQHAQTQHAQTQYAQTQYAQTQYAQTQYAQTQYVRTDVQFIETEIKRFKDNAKSFFSINNEMKAEALSSALSKALANGVTDVRKDAAVKEALAIHRIFSFFGTKSTTATQHNEESLTASPDPYTL